MDSAATIDRLGAEARQLAPGVPGLRLVVLFGSVARGQPFPDSDVDLAFLGAGHWGSLDLGSQLAAIVGREAHVVEIEHASDLLRFEIARQGVPLFASADSWQRFQAESVVRYFDLAPLVALCTEGARRRLAREAHRG